jgi:rRNA-processing protein FCF1
MKVILDSSFIISCVKRNIDFIDELEGKGFEILLAKEVLQELKDLRLKVTHDERMAIDIAEQLFAKRKLKKIALGKDKVDTGLIHKGKSGYYIATLDAAIKRDIPDKVTISNAKNGIQIERT